MYRTISYLLVALSTLSALFPLTASRIGDIEYSVPEEKKWKIGQRFKTSDGETIIYLPQGKIVDEPQNWDEVFTIQMSKTKLNFPVLLQQDAIYGFGDLEHIILEETADSTLIEWWTNGVPCMHSWIRCLHTTNSTVSLQYTITDVSRIEEARLVWEPILRDAKRM